MNPMGYTDPQSLPFHYRANGDPCDWSGHILEQCPNGCDHADHYTNDGHAACADKLSTQGVQVSEAGAVPLGAFPKRSALAWPYPEMVRATDSDCTFSIDCPTCGATSNELCLTESGWGPDGFAHPERTTTAVVECSWMADEDREPLLLRAVSLDAPWTGGVSPNVDSVTIEIMSEELAPEFADLVPAEDGLYHLGPLGWTFSLVREASA